MLWLDYSWLEESGIRLIAWHVALPIGFGVSIAIYKSRAGSLLEPNAAGRPASGKEGCVLGGPG